MDWSRTRAYALGLNGLYVNVKGREKDGIVEPADARGAGERDCGASCSPPSIRQTGQRRDHQGVSPRAGLSPGAGNEDIAPDLIVGYAKGTRGSDESALGGLPREVFVDNTSAWSGDHCMDHETVPGILLTSRPLKRPAPIHPGRWRPRFSPSSASTASPIAAAARSADMFGPRIKLDKALLAKVKRYADLAGYSSVDEFVTHVTREGAGEARRVRLGGGDQEEAEGAWLHFLSARWRR